jgi:hypothetical protein
MGLWFREPLPAGTRVALLVPTLTAARQRTVLARVVHATAAPGGGWIIGCALDELLREDELRACFVPLPFA